MGSTPTSRGSACNKSRSRYNQIPANGKQCLNCLSHPRGQAQFITYLFDHPTFQNTLLSGAALRNFRVTYTGWGCLNRIVALTEYDDVKKSPTVTVFDMCKLLGGGWAQE